MHSTIDPVRMFSKLEASKLMGIGKKTLQELIDTGKLGVIHVGASYKIAYGEILSFIKSYTQYNKQEYTKNSSESDEAQSEKNTIETNSKNILDKLKGELLNGKRISKRK